MNTNNPSINSRKLLQFCSEINSNRPFYVDVKPQTGSQISECFPNVKTHIEEHGGELIHGWSICEFPRIMLEAEFHGIWKSPEGQFLDITPSQINAMKILFLQEENLRHDFNNPDKTVNNKRFPLMEHPVIYKLFETLDKRHALLDKYPHGKSVLTGEDADELLRLEAYKTQYFLELKAVNRSRRSRHPLPRRLRRPKSKHHK